MSLFKSTTAAARAEDEEVADAGSGADAGADAPLLKSTTATARTEDVEVAGADAGADVPFSRAVEEVADSGAGAGAGTDAPFSRAVDDPADVDVFDRSVDDASFAAWFEARIAAIPQRFDPAYRAVFDDARDAVVRWRRRFAWPVWKKLFKVKASS